MRNLRYWLSVAASIAMLGYATPALAWDKPDLSAECTDDARIHWTVRTTGDDTGDLKVTLKPGSQSSTIHHTSTHLTSSGTFNGEAGKDYIAHVEWKPDTAASDSVKVECDEKEKPPAPPPPPPPVPPVIPPPPPVPPVTPLPPVVAPPAPPAPVAQPQPAPTIKKPDKDNGRRGNGKTKNARSACDRLQSDKRRARQLQEEADRRGQYVNWANCTFMGSKERPEPERAVYVPPPPAPSAPPPIFTPPPPIEEHVTPAIESPPTINPEAPDWEPVPSEFITGPPEPPPAQFPPSERGK